MIKKKIKKNKGFVLLFAVMLSSIILAITLGVANIVLKEINFSTSAKDTNDAFFAADAGVECALFNDKATSNSFIETEGSGTVECLGSAIALNGAFPVWNFIIPGLGNGGQSCAKVTVDKSIPSAVVIDSKGYNVGDALCLSSSQNRVERELEVSFVGNSPVVGPSFPTISLSASPVFITPDSSTTLSWSSTDATSCTAFGDWSGTKSTSGSEIKNSNDLPSDASFKLTCTGPVGAVSSTINVRVGDPTPPIQNDSFCINITSPDSVAAGSTFNGSVKVQNIGSNTWKDATQDAVRFHGLTNWPWPVTQPAFSASWNVLPQPTITPNSFATFPISVTAPNVPGVYPFAWRMLQQNVEWFGPTCSQNITVTAP